MGVDPNQLVLKLGDQDPCCYRFFNHMVNPLTVINDTASQDTKSGLLIRECNRKIVFLFLSQNICFGYSKEPSH